MTVETTAVDLTAREAIVTVDLTTLRPADFQPRRRHPADRDRLALLGLAALLPVLGLLSYLAVLWAQLTFGVRP